MSIKDGDFFGYSWKIGCGPISDSYWCRDARCVARTNNQGDIVLIDTYNYWPYKGSQEDTNIFTYEGLCRDYSKRLDIEKFDLTFICNLNDYEFVKEYKKDDYDGVVFVGYQCERKWAIPKGSSPSNKAIREKLQREMAKLISEHEYAAYRIGQIRKELLVLDESYQTPLQTNS